MLNAQQVSINIYDVIADNKKIAAYQYMERYSFETMKR